MQAIKHFTDEHNRIFASVSVDTVNQFLMCSWREQNALPELFELIHYCEEVTHSFNLKYVLSDVTVCHKRFQADLQTELLEGFSHAGLIKVALVNRALHCPIDTRPEGMEVMYFQQLPLAIEWFFLPVLEDDAWEDLEVMEF